MDGKGATAPTEASKSPSARESLSKTKGHGSSSSSEGKKESKGIQGPGDTVVPTNKSSFYEFYNSIGCPRYVVAPMVNQSELPFRMMCRKYNADLAYTPMIHAGLCLRHRGASSGGRGKVRFIDSVFATCAEDQPLVAQFCANTPEAFVAGAKMVEGRCQAIDLNLGCPQGIAKRGHYGAFLLEDTRLIREMVTTACLHLKTPVTCKIRVLPKEEDTLALAHTIEECGAKILAVHGRTRDMLQEKLGKCDWDIIKKIKQQMKIPIFANGGIENFEDCKRCTDYTGVDGVMVSEALLENPALFSGKTYDSLDMAEEYIEYLHKYNYDPCGTFAARGHLFKLLYKDLNYYTDLRNKMNKATNEFILSVPGIIRKRREEEKSTAKIRAMGTWYRRHRDRAIEIEQRNREKEAKLRAERKLQGKEEEEDCFLTNFFDDTDEEDDDDE